MRRIFFYVEIDRAIYRVGVTFPDDSFDHANLFHDMPGGRRFDTWVQVIELAHGPMEKISVFLHQFHWFQFLDYRLFCDLVFCLPAFLFKMTGVGDIPDITDLIPEVQEIPVDKIEGDK